MNKPVSINATAQDAEQRKQLEMGRRECAESEDCDGGHRVDQGQEEPGRCRHDFLQIIANY
jgi:hypothetical protein